MRVRDHIPLEQGLRHVSYFRSRKKIRQRPYSIRTRIKTVINSAVYQSQAVRDHIPLEQGLRQNIRYLCGRNDRVRDHIPLEQGLRLHEIFI